ncbi:rhamnan synthesis F family protein [Sphingomonas sp. LY29]|uniref:rhamnan synthesis F family protein n=1 Tax=Sphingomonas sp. LY29 TaxID=3095341 RepID=UPI002D79A8BD|nr:rhamnan synthesis F family protein [Sphingomonas sp. LY29]WRP25317.1 rhamnan synthesis F family protein [Sphingomonas sp. LY29]
MMTAVQDGEGSDAVTASDEVSLYDIVEQSERFDPTYYAGLRGFSKSLDRAALARDYVDQGEAEGLSPGPFFDPAFYAHTYPDLAKAECKFAHFIQYGQAEGRHGTFASFLMAEGLDQQAIAEGLVPFPGHGPDHPDYLRGLIDALRKGEADEDFFSAAAYIRFNPDLRDFPIPPLIHYMRHGRAEGRRSNLDVLDSIIFNDRVVTPGLPFILVGIHEGSQTGAPKVGLDLAQELSSQFNVIFFLLNDGPLLDIAQYRFPITVHAGTNMQEALFIYESLNARFGITRAVFSSVACEPLIRTIAECDVQIVCLVHEFREDFFQFERSIVNYCDLLVFSSERLRTSWATLIQEVGRPPQRSIVLPQPPSAGSERKWSRAEARSLVEKSLNIDLGDDPLVLAAGAVQMRKGVDTFLQVATDLRRRRRRHVCVWVGQQVNEHDRGFGIWLHVHIKEAACQFGTDVVHFVPAGPAYEVLMDAADVFVVPSRLDPLPNVALDAALRATPVVAFAGATGLGDLARLGEIDLIEADYGSVEQIVDAIERTTASQAAKWPWKKRQRPEHSVGSVRTYGNYAAEVFKAAEALRDLPIEPNETVDPDYTGPALKTRFNRFNDEREMVETKHLIERSLRLGIATFNPRPGVHSRRDENGRMAHYRSVWCQDRRIEDVPASTIVHVHAYYPDVLPEIFGQFAKGARSASFVITTPNEEKASEIRTIGQRFSMENIDIVVTPSNRGRDIGPFIDELASRCAPSDVVCHVHTKKSPEAGDWFGERWRDNMYRSVLSQPAIDLFNDPAVGLVIPDNPRNNGWTENWAEAKKIAAAWTENLPYHPGPFPIGNMFWVRGAVLHAMREATIQSTWPTEPIKVDGTVLHAIERLWPMACAQVGLELAAVYARESRDADCEKSRSSSDVDDQSVTERRRIRDRFYRALTETIPAQS